MPSVIPNYLKVAVQRLEAADFLIDSGFTKDGMYLAGYAVECSLKALILHLTPEVDRMAMFERISSGATWHYPEALGGILKGELGTPIPLPLVRKYRRFGWSTSLRYETGRADLGEARGVWKTGKATHDWVNEKLA